MKKLFKALAIAILSLMLLIPVNSAIAGDCEADACSSTMLGYSADPDGTCLAHILNGLVIRPRFSWSTGAVNEFIFTAGTYHIARGAGPGPGNSKKEILTFWDETLDLTIGNQLQGWVYIAIYGDHINTAPASIKLDDADFRWVTPTQGSKRWDENASYYGATGWNDRIIFAIWNLHTSGGMNIKRFQHDGGRYVQWEEPFIDLAGSDIDNVWTDVQLTVPDFDEDEGTLAEVTFRIYNASSSSPRKLFYRTKGASTAGGNLVGATDSDGKSININTVTVMPDKDGKIQVKMDESGGQKVEIQTNGYYLPAGM